MFLRKLWAGAFLTCASLSFVVSADLSDPMQLFLKNNRGTTHTYECRTNYTFGQVVNFAAEKESVTAEEVSLIFAGRSLSTPENLYKTISQFGIQKQSTLHIVLRPKASVTSETEKQDQPLSVNQAGPPNNDNHSTDDTIDKDDCLKADSNALDEANQKRLNKRCIDAAKTFDDNMSELEKVYQEQKISWDNINRSNWVGNDKHPILKVVQNYQEKIELLDSSLDESIGSQRADQKNREKVMKIIGPKLGFDWENLFYDYISKLSSPSEKSDISKIIDGLSLSATDRVSVNSFVKMSRVHYSTVPPKIDIVKKVLTNKAITKYLVLMAARYGESYNAFFDEATEGKLDVLSKTFFEGKSLTTVKADYWNRRVKKTIAGTGGAFDGPGHNLAGFDYRSSNGGFIGFDDHN